MTQTRLDMTEPAPASVCDGSTVTDAGNPALSTGSWSDADKQRLRVAFADPSLGWADVAEAVQRSPKACRHMANAMDLGTRVTYRTERAREKMSVTGEQLVSMRSLLATGMGVRAVSARVGLSRHTVARVAKELGLGMSASMPPPPLSGLPQPTRRDYGDAPLCAFHPVSMAVLAEAEGRVS